MPMLTFDTAISTYDDLKNGVLSIGTSRCQIWVDHPGDATTIPASAIQTAALAAMQMAARHGMPTSTDLIY